MRSSKGLRMVKTADSVLLFYKSGIILNIQNCYNYWLQMHKLLCAKRRYITMRESHVLLQNMVIWQHGKDPPPLQAYLVPFDSVDTCSCWTSQEQDAAKGPLARFCTTEASRRSLTYHNTTIIGRRHQGWVARHSTPTLATPSRRLQTTRHHQGFFLMLLQCLCSQGHLTLIYVAVSLQLLSASFSSIAMLPSTKLTISNVVQTGDCWAVLETIVQTTGILFFGLFLRFRSTCRKSKITAEYSYVT